MDLQVNLHQMVDPNYVVNPAMNMYFLAVSAVVLTILGAIVTEKYVAPLFWKIRRLSRGYINIKRSYATSS